MVVPLALFLLGIGLLGIGYLFWRNYQMTKTLKEELDNLKEVQEVLITKAALKGRDEERQRLARDWHDGLGNVLSTARLITDTLTTDNPAQLKVIQNLLEDSHTLSKSIIRNLQSTSLHSYEDLIDYLKTLQSRLALGAIDLQYDVSPSNRFTQLSPEDKWHFYNILQELISNIIKHAHATTISIIVVEKQKLILSVIDNGIGFDPTQSPIPKTIGERVYLLNGQLRIRKQQPQGTAISIEIG